MTSTTLLKRPSAFLPLAMSCAALALVVGLVALFGLVRQEDEGAAARLFQLLLVAQLPIIAFFAITWLPRAPRRARDSGAAPGGWRRSSGARRPAGGVGRSRAEHA